MKVFVVTGTEKFIDTEVYGVFTTRGLAEECRDTLKEELEYLQEVFIEEVELDAFGHR